MESRFQKISCVDPNTETNLIKPISLDLDVKNKINPVSGARYTTDDVNAFDKRYRSQCLLHGDEGGKIKMCCDPKETRFQIPKILQDRYKNKKIKVNREFNEPKSIEVCQDSKQCQGSEWIEPNSYLMCKIGDNKASVQDNIMKYDTLNPDCYAITRNTNNIDIANVIGGIGKKTESIVIQDTRLANSIKDDNYQDIIDFLGKYQRQNGKSGVDLVLTDDENGDTLLLRSIREGATKTISVLLGNGADVNRRSLDNGMTPLHYAAKYGDGSMISELINYGARTETKDFLGRSPVFYSVQYGSKNDVMYLVNQNPATLQMVDKDGNSLLHIAMMNHQEPVKERGAKVKYLTENGILAGLKNNVGLTADDLGRQTLKLLKEQEDKMNTEKFLEPFSTLGQAVEIDYPDDPNLANEMKDLYTGLTILDRAHVSENQDVYKGFVSAKNNLKGPVKFEKYGCYPYADVTNQAECEARGGSWQQFNDEDLTTTAMVDYQKDITKDDMYYDPKVEQEPIKKIEGLDHDSLMNITPAPTTIPTPTSEVYLDQLEDGTTITPTTSPEDKKEEMDLQKYFYMMVIAILILLVGLGGYTFYKKYYLS